MCFSDALWVCAVRTDKVKNKMHILVLGITFEQATWFIMHPHKVAGDGELQGDLRNKWWWVSILS